MFTLHCESKDPTVLQLHACGRGKKQQLLIQLHRKHLEILILMFLFHYANMNHIIIFVMLECIPLGHISEHSIKKFPAWRKIHDNLETTMLCDKKENVLFFYFILSYLKLHY